jgi:hypothetical protein
MCVFPYFLPSITTSTEKLIFHMVKFIITI